MEKTNYQKMISGEPYNGADPVLLELQMVAQERMLAFQAALTGDMKIKQKALNVLFGSMNGSSLIIPPFSVEYGIHIHLGKHVFINKGATFLDSSDVTIGDHVAVGPNVQFLTVTHPVKPEERFKALPDSSDSLLPFEVSCIAKPISLGAASWIGAGTILMPGVSIGCGTVVGAGSVVTRSLPDRVVAVGSPARIIRAVDD
ncbi:MAG: sugar O-acetyltransferase [Hyphomicrobiales bacterium]